MSIKNPYTDVTKVEKELNEKYWDNRAIDPHDIQLFVRLDDFNYYPVPCYIDKDRKFHVEDSQAYAGRELFVGSKHQFLHHQYKIKTTNPNGDIYLALEDGKDMATAWDPTRFVMFRNGYLINACLYQVIIPSFDNSYGRKFIYSAVPFKNNDRIDLFYIESRDNEFQQVRFNQDIYIQTRQVVWDNKTSNIIKIPYPYSAYPRDKHMFYIFSGKTGCYLDARYDFTTDEPTNEYVTLNYPDRDMKESYIVFTFPYAKEEFEDESDTIGIGEKSGVSFFACYSYPDDDSESYKNNEGILKFDPVFTTYRIKKENILLFRNTTLMQPELYEVKNNSTIKLLDSIAKKTVQFDRYTMLIFAETERAALRARRFEFQVEQSMFRGIYYTKNGIYYACVEIPDTIPEGADFLLFQGTILYDVESRYKIATVNGRKCVMVPQANFEGLNKIDQGGVRVTKEKPGYTLKTNAILGYQLDGTPMYQRDFYYTETDVDNIRPFTFIFYNRKPYNTKKYIEIVKIYFTSTQEGKVKIVNNSKYDLDNYNSKNLVLFYNGVYLTPDRYSVDPDTLEVTFDTNIDILPNNNAFTGIFLVSNKLQGEFDDWLYYDMMDGDPNKLCWFDEGYARPHKYQG